VKVQAWVWKFWQKALPTKQVLGSRGMNVNTICSRCMEVDESIDHLIWECRKSQL